MKTNCRMAASMLLRVASISIVFGLTGMTAALAKDPYRWVQYVSGGLEARAITEDSACPVALLNGTSVNMLQRSSSGAQYPILVCALPLPSGTTRIEIGGTNLQLPRNRPQRILVIGDTGCRLKDKRVQACNDPEAWPFRAGASHMSQLKPDLIMHVGDFHYRETPCPEGNVGCAGSPYGDSWEVWEQDFFAPVGSLLRAAPWVMVRGNHEECERGGRGWARTLDPYAWSSDTGCLGPGDPYIVDLGGINIAVLDVSTADEDKANEQQAERYRKQFKSLENLVPTDPLWIAQHRPIWAVEETKPKLGGDNKTLALAASAGLPANVQAFLSGHHHVLEVLRYEGSLPLQIVSGNGGDDLSRNVPTHSDGLVINGVRVKQGIAKTGVFGYSLLERISDTDPLKWTFSGFDYQGRLLLKCELWGREAVCN